MPDADAKLLHLRLGWWCVAAFALAGLVLEGMHGFKSGWLLDVSSETRRHMLTLAHAHGTLLGLLNLGFAWSCTVITWRAERLAWASRCVVAATIGMPLGFGLGGVFAQGGDPGLGVVLVPVAAVCLVVAAVLAAVESKPTSARDSSG